MVETIWEYVRVIGGALILASTIRTLAYEPFKIPSSSMVPTLLIGDYLFVNKHVYGFREPCTGKRTEGEAIQRGDVVVFEEKKGVACGLALGLGSLNFIKRVIALPGDTIEYKDKTLFVNSERLTTEFQGQYEYEDSKDMELEASLYKETLSGIRHDILLMDSREGMDVAPMVVPEGHFVVMGDNRDNSRDSRFWSYPSWGFVKKEDIVGRADVLFWSWAPGLKVRTDRIGQTLRPEVLAGDTAL